MRWGAVGRRPSCHCAHAYSKSARCRGKDVILTVQQEVVLPDPKHALLTKHIVTHSVYGCVVLLPCVCQWRSSATSSAADFHRRCDIPTQLHEQYVHQHILSTRLLQRVRAAVVQHRVPWLRGLARLARRIRVAANHIPVTMASLMSMRRLGVFGSPRVAPRVAAPCLSAARAPARGALVIVAAEKGPQKMDSAVKRAKLAEDRRMRNKARKSAIATRIKKVCVCAPTCSLSTALAAGRQISGC
jgi:hypothetical protein